MTSKEIIEKVAEKTENTKKLIAEILDTTEVVLKEGMSEVDAKLKVFDITFETKKKEARTARNPKTGVAVEVPARKKMLLKLSADWKRLMKD